MSTLRLRTTTWFVSVFVCVSSALIKTGPPYPRLPAEDRNASVSSLRLRVAGSESVADLGKNWGKLNDAIMYHVQEMHHVPG